MKHFLFLLIGSMMVCGCKTQKKSPDLKVGEWKGTMMLLEGKRLPFNFSMENDENGTYVMKVRNAEEVVVFDEIKVSKDSIHIKMMAFDGYISATFTEDEIVGNFIEENLERSVPFRATYGQEPRFITAREPKTNISGVWEVEFNVDQPESAYGAKGIFIQNGHKITGTFRTKTGDYRYLEGVVDGDSLKLSTFDGTHAYLFSAAVSNNLINGRFYIGTHAARNFRAVRNEAFELPDANTLTYVKEGYHKFDFSFPDVDGNWVSLSDEQFKDKVVLVQLMGTWCPNCLDETRFFREYLKENPNNDLKLVALAFEYAKTKKRAINSIDRFKKRLDVDYPVLLAQYGSVNKEEAAKKLPMLNAVISYPTTIFLDKKGVVRKIHTGFNGPATGINYEEFKVGFSKTLDMLLAE